jgi:hypothetical protein
MTSALSSIFQQFPQSLFIIVLYIILIILIILHSNIKMTPD